MAMIDKSQSVLDELHNGDTVYSLVKRAKEKYSKNGKITDFEHYFHYTTALKHMNTLVAEGKVKKEKGKYYRIK